jgi:hypothetical protein
MNHGTKFCRLSQASTAHHPNVFTPILSLSEGRCSFPPSDIKRLLFSPQMFSLYFYSYTILFDSLSVFKGSIFNLMLSLHLLLDLPTDRFTKYFLVYFVIALQQGTLTSFQPSSVHGIQSDLRESRQLHAK